MGVVQCYSRGEVGEDEVGPSVCYERVEVLEVGMSVRNGAKCQSLYLLCDIKLAAHDRNLRYVRRKTRPYLRFTHRDKFT